MNQKTSRTWQAYSSADQAPSTGWERMSATPSSAGRNRDSGAS